MKNRASLLLTFIAACCSSCTIIQESPKYHFTDGVYKTSIRPGTKKRSYVEIAGDTIKVYAMQSTGSRARIDTLQQPELLFTEFRKAQPLQSYTFIKPSFDLDLITIPVKYRPRAEGFPRQLNTSLQAAVYLGYRSDLYRVTYSRTALGFSERHINHFGISAGFFSGLGASAVEPQLTRQQVAQEYDGVIMLNGLAVLLAVNNFTMGLAAGADLLLDRNRSHWIYNRKPWLGVVFGLNLN